MKYKAANTRVLEAESGETPLDIHLDQTVLKSRERYECSEVINLSQNQNKVKNAVQKGKKVHAKNYSNAG